MLKITLFFFIQASFSHLALKENKSGSVVGKHNNHCCLCQSFKTAQYVQTPCPKRSSQTFLVPQLLLPPNSFSFCPGSVLPTTVPLLPLWALGLFVVHGPWLPGPSAAQRVLPLLPRGSYLCPRHLTNYKMGGLAAVLSKSSAHACPPLPFFFLFVN